jgi:hypothetical protein
LQTTSWFHDIWSDSDIRLHPFIVSSISKADEQPELGTTLSTRRSVKDAPSPAAGLPRQAGRKSCEQNKKHALWMHLQDPIRHVSSAALPFRDVTLNEQQRQAVEHGVAAKAPLSLSSSLPARALARPIL